MPRWHKDHAAPRPLRARCLHEGHNIHQHAVERLKVWRVQVALENGALEVGERQFLDQLLTAFCPCLLQAIKERLPP